MQYFNRLFSAALNWNSFATLYFRQMPNFSAIWLPPNVVNNGLAYATLNESQEHLKDGAQNWIYYQHYVDLNCLSVRQKPTRQKPTATKPHVTKPRNYSALYNIQAVLMDIDYIQTKYSEQLVTPSVSIDSFVRPSSCELNTLHCISCVFYCKPLTLYSLLNIDIHSRPR